MVGDIHTVEVYKVYKIGKFQHIDELLEADTIKVLAEVEKEILHYTTLFVKFRNDREAMDKL